MTKRAINPDDLSDPVGFAHAWLVENGPHRELYLAGQCGYDKAGKVVHKGDLAGQLDQAMANISAILRDADMEFADVVQLNLYVTSRDDYALARTQIGAIWRKHCGKHYPGMAMFQVVSLFDPDALIEVQGIAAR